MSGTAERPREQYRVREGVHYALNADWKGGPRHSDDRMVRLTKGDVLESSEDLTVKFPNKFDKVTPDGPGQVVVTEERIKTVNQLIAGAGWTEADRSFLQTLPEDGFARITRMSQIQKNESKKGTSPLGDDVTDTFQQAYDNGFKVYRNAAGKHQVVLAGQTKPANLKPLEAADVDKFVATYMKDK